MVHFTFIEIANVTVLHSTSIQFLSFFSYHHHHHLKLWMLDYIYESVYPFSVCLSDRHFFMQQFKLFVFISFLNENDNARSNIIACHHQNHASIFMHEQYVYFYAFLYSLLYFVKQSSTFSPWKFTQLPLKLPMIYFSSMSVLSVKWVVASFFYRLYAQLHIYFHNIFYICFLPSQIQNTKFFCSRRSKAMLILLFKPFLKQPIKIK